MNELLIVSAVVLVVVFVLGWLWQLKTQQPAIVDIIWSFGTGITAIIYLVLGEGDATVRAVTGLICLVWFGRLGTHLLKRLRVEHEDGRYLAMRESMGPYAGIGFLLFFLLQAGFTWFFALPMWFISAGQSGSTVQLSIALLIASVAWFGVHTSDKQLQAFKVDPSNKGKTCDTGLWRYSRHPNYFFEWTHWFIYPILGFYSPGFIYLCFAPVIMFIFLYYLTGIRFSEQQAIRTRGENYIRYQKITSPFIPWRQKDVSHNDFS